METKKLLPQYSLGLQCYFLAQEFTKQKDVLDLVSEGTIEIFSETRSYTRLNFLTSLGKLSAIPSNSIDVVICFNFPEDKEIHFTLLKEIKRVSRATSILFTSLANNLTSIKSLSADKKLYFANFRRLLKMYFKYIRFFGHNINMQSHTYDLLEPPTDLADVSNIKIKEIYCNEPAAFIAVCSDLQENVDHIIPLKTDNEFLEYFLNLEKAYNNLFMDFIKVNKELYSMRHSHSWKITKPLRRVRAILSFF